MSIADRICYEASDGVQCSSVEEKTDNVSYLSFIGGFIILLLIIFVSFGIIIVYLYHIQQTELKYFVQHEVEQKISVFAKTVNESETVNLLEELKQLKFKVTELEEKLKKTKIDPFQGLKSSSTDFYNRIKLVTFDPDEDDMYQSPDDDEDENNSSITVNESSIERMYTENESISEKNMTQKVSTTPSSLKQPNSNLRATTTPRIKNSEDDDDDDDDEIYPTRIIFTYPTTTPNTPLHLNYSHSKSKVRKRNAEISIIAPKNDIIRNTSKTEKLEHKPDFISTTLNRIHYEIFTEPSNFTSSKASVLKFSHPASRHTSIKSLYANEQSVSRTMNSNCEPAKNCNLTDIDDYPVAAHFGIRFPTNQSNSYVNQELYTFEPSDWHENYDIERYLTVNHSHIMISTTGLYFIYAQILFSDLSSSIGFKVFKNNEEVLQCITSILALNSIRTNNKNTISCYTGGIVFCKSGDIFTIKNNERHRQIIISSSKSFFGLFKLG